MGRKKWLLMILLAVTAAGLGFTAGFVFKSRRFNSASRLALVDRGFYPLDQTMEAGGFEKVSEGAYEKTAGGVKISVAFDLAGGIAAKNEYSFSLKDAIEDQGGETFIRKSLLESILNRKLSFGEGCVRTEPLSFPEGSWPGEELLIAHAGGSIRDSHTALRTGSAQALTVNYDLGYRFFEFDFLRTSDGAYASIHDWSHFVGSFEGSCPDAEDFLDGAVLDSKKQAFYPSMLLDDVLDAMMVNQDIFLIPDTKFAENAKEDYERIVSLARERDPSLPDRIIPQIYCDEMFFDVMAAYPFPRVIYTTYQRKEADASEIVSFCEQHKEITVITAGRGDERFDSPEIVSRIHSGGRLLFRHTVNSYPDMVRLLNLGSDGFYTDLLLPVEYRLAGNREQVSGLAA